MESGALAAREPWFVSSRVRAPEWAVGAAALALGLDLFVLPWYGSTGGWSSLGLERYLVVLAASGGLAVVWLQGALRAPAIPVCATTLELLVSGLALLGLVVRLAVGPAGSAAGAPAGVGAYLAVALCAVLAVGSYLSLRRDGIRDADGPGPVERMSLAEPHDD
jgi:hypothetical protein